MQPLAQDRGGWRHDMSDDGETALDKAWREADDDARAKHIQRLTFFPLNQKAVIAEFMLDQESVAQAIDEIDCDFATRARRFGTTADQRKERGRRDYKRLGEILGTANTAQTRKSLVKSIHGMDDSEFERVEKCDASVIFDADKLLRRMSPIRREENDAFLRAKLEQMETPKIRGVVPARRP